MKTNYLKIALLFLVITFFIGCDDDSEPGYISNLVSKIWIESYKIDNTRYQQELIFNRGGDGSEQINTFYSNGRIDKDVWYFNWKYTKTWGEVKEIRMDYAGTIIYFEVEEIDKKILRGYLNGEYVEFTPR